MFRVVGLLIAALCASCLEPTQVSYRITTDIPCDLIEATSVTAGLEGETEKAEPTKVTTDCNADGTVGAIGSFAVKPAVQGQPIRAAFKVVVSVDPAVDVRQCTPTQGYAGCIVGRRRVSFVPHRSLNVPIELLLICKGVACDENSTCNRLGRCVSSLVDPDACEGDLCSETESKPGPGLACFDTGAAEQFCSTAAPWCTRDVSGVMGCAQAPIANGDSLECRTASDCLTGFKCAAPGGSIRGVCVPRAADAGMIICQPDDTRACPGDCNTNQGAGYFACTSTVPWEPPDDFPPPCDVVQANPDAASDSDVFNCISKHHFKPCELEACATRPSPAGPVPVEGTCPCSLYLRINKSCTAATCAGLAGGSACITDPYFERPPFNCSGDRSVRTLCLVRHLLRNNVCRL